MPYSILVPRLPSPGFCCTTFLFLLLYNIPLIPALPDGNHLLILIQPGRDFSVCDFPSVLLIYLKCFIPVGTPPSWHDHHLSIVSFCKIRMTVSCYFISFAIFSNAIIMVQWDIISVAHSIIIR